MKFLRKCPSYILSNKSNKVLSNHTHKKICKISNAFTDDFINFLKEMAPTKVPVSLRQGKGYMQELENEGLSHHFQSFLVPGEYVSIEPATISSEFHNFILDEIENLLDLPREHLVGLRMQYNIFPLNSQYHTLTLIPHTDVARKNITPVAVNLNLTSNHTLRTAFYEYDPINRRKDLEAKKMILEGDSYIDKIIRMNPEYTDSEKILLEDWNKYEEICLEKGELSIYQGDYYHAPFLKPDSNSSIRLSIAIFLIYGDEIVSSVSRNKIERNLMMKNMKHIRGYKLIS